jgi:hypothetical protein
MPKQTHGEPGWISARNGKWHRATVAEPVAYRPETAACGLIFRPLHITWHGEHPPNIPRDACQRPGCGS